MEMSKSVFHLMNFDLPNVWTRSSFVELVSLCYCFKEFSPLPDAYPYLCCNI
jgi:hypothetical protein